MEEKNVIEIKNKRAEYEYFLLDDYTAGIVLTGTEIKSIRDGKANLTDAYCTFIGNELFVRQMHWLGARSSTTNAKASRRRTQSGICSANCADREGELKRTYPEPSM